MFVTMFVILVWRAGFVGGSGGVDGYCHLPKMIWQYQLKSKDFEKPWKYLTTVVMQRSKRHLPISCRECSSHIEEYFSICDVKWPLHHPRKFFRHRPSNTPYAFGGQFHADWSMQPPCHRVSMRILSKSKSLQIYSQGHETTRV